MRRSEVNRLNKNVSETTLVGGRRENYGSTSGKIVSPILDLYKTEGSSVNVGKGNRNMQHY